MRRLLLSLILFLPLLSVGEPSDEQILEKLRSKLKGKQDFTERSLKRIGNKTLELEVLVSSFGNFESATEIFGDWRTFPKWSMKNINRRPSGGEYVMKILSLGVSPKDKSNLLAKMSVELPIYKKQIDREFRMRTEKTDKSFTLHGETVQDSDSMLGPASGFLKIFRAEGSNSQLWIYISGKATLRNWLVYEALPEKLLTRESAERVQIVMDNYYVEEDRRKALGGRQASSSDRIEAPKKER